MTTQKEIIDRCRRLDLTEEDLQMIEAIRASIKTEEDREFFRQMDWKLTANVIHTAEALTLSGRVVAWVAGSALGTLIMINQFKDEMSKLIVWILGR